MVDGAARPIDRNGIILFAVPMAITTILAWVGAIVLALVAACLFLPGNLTSTGHVTGNPESKQAEDLVYRNFPPDPNAADELVVVRSPTHTVDDPVFKEFVTSLYRQGDATGVVYRAHSYLDSAAPLVSANRHAALIEIQRQKDVDDLLPVIERNDGREGFRVTITGSARSTTTSTTSRSTT